MSSQWTDSDPRAMYPYICAICDRVRPAGSPLAKHRGEYVCPECCPGGDDE